MIVASIPDNESERLAALRSFDVLDSEPEEGFERITNLASRLLKAPIAAVSLIDESRQWFKSVHGLTVSETHRDVAFCSHTICSDDVLVVPDATADPRFCGNPLVTGEPGIRFYAGAPLRTKEGLRIGALCVIDSQARAGWGANESSTLSDLADLVMDELDLRRTTRDLSQVNAALTYNGEHDVLTGLPNRVSLEADLEAAVRAARDTNTEVGLIYFDLDRFKTINDTLGHHAGDGLLVQAAERLRALSPDEAVYRLVGDEFAIVCRSSSAEALAGTLVERFAKPFDVNGKKILATVSAGIARFPADADSPETLLSNADLAMYAAKRAGKNRYASFVSEMGATVRRQHDIETYLYQALDEDLFGVYYQPQVLHDGTIIGVEALIRLQNHPTLGPVSPGEFIPIAEESDLMLEIGRRVLQQACMQGAIWQSAGHSIKVAVNVSALQLNEPSFLKTVKNALLTSGLHPELLQLELTETALMSDPERCAATMSEIQRMGVSIALDDFGSGYSSFRYLHQLPLETLKIDMLFVKGLAGTPSTLPMLRAIIAVGQNMNLRVVAEGVETDAQRAILWGAGCKIFQGYLFGKPQTAEELTALLLHEKGAEKPIRILVAEDSKDSRFLLQAYCRGTAYQLTFAEDGERAVAAFQSGSFDLVLMDSQMPVMDGLTATRQIRAIEEARGQTRVPILALSANALQHDVALALEAGCDAHFAKPVSKKAFLHALEQWQGASRPAEPALLIEIPEGLEDLAKSYLVARQRELSVFEGLLGRSDFEEVRQLAHNLKGSGASFGFPDITRLGGAIEQASKDRNVTDLSEQLTKLSAYIQSAGQQMEATFCS